MNRDHTRYSFFGSKKLYKNHLIREVIAYYLKNKPNTTLSILKNTFPKKSDFNVDMFATGQDYETFNKDKKERYFDEPFNLSNGEIFYLSNNWGGDVFQDLLKDLRETFGYEIEAINNNNAKNINVHRDLFIEIAESNNLKYQKGKVAQYFQIYPNNISHEGSRGTHYEFISEKGVLYLDIHIESKAKTDIRQLRKRIKEFSENHGYSFYTNVRPVRVNISTLDDSDIKDTFNEIYAVFQPAIENVYGETLIGKAKKVFLHRFPTFNNFENPSEKYLDEEYNYKVECLEKSKKYLDELTEDNALEIIPKILNSTGDCNLFRWQSIDNLKKLPQDKLSWLYQLTNRLVVSFQNDVLKDDFDDIAQGILGVLKSKAFVWKYMSYLLFVLDQKKHISVQASAIDDSLKFFHREAFVKGSLISYATYMVVVNFAFEIMYLLEEWKPKNMIDMHSFFWVLSKNKDYIAKLSPTNDVIISKKDTAMTLNTILYGPPGTSKTYSTTNMAVEIIDGIASTSNKDAKKRFEELQSNGQISMITFHQSYGYEEFVEGLKASSIDGNISYDIQDGIFKKMSLNAKSINPTSRLENFSFNTSRIFKMSLGGIYDPDIKEWCLDNDYISMGWGENIDFSSMTNDEIWIKFRDDMKVFLKDKIDEKDIRYTTQVMFQFKNYMREGDLVLVSHGNSTISSIGQIDGEYEFNDNAEIRYSQFRKIKWLIKDANIPIEKIYNKKLSQQTLYEFDKDAIKKDSFSGLFEINKKSNENYVLIIDEINRGNISKIFGELITLVEPSKRLNNDDEMKVTLPYSGEEFEVPSNLYIIGTMNTADRSIALLDTALRRRFEFIEMMPNIKQVREEIGIIDSIDVAKLLKRINKRIEVLYDRNHMIGHTYFLDVKTFDTLKDVIQNRVIPLLQEYFYDDWKKINMVFNNNGFIVENSIKDSLFSNVEDPDLDEELKIYSINIDALDDREEYQKIYQ